MSEGCLAVLGFTAVGSTYYDTHVKVRQRIMPFILWIRQHRAELTHLATSSPRVIELSGRTFTKAKGEPYPDSCFIVNLDDDTWRDIGTLPVFVDWGEVWACSKYQPYYYRILWDELPTWDEYRKRTHLEKIDRDPWRYVYEASADFCESVRLRLLG